MSAFGLKKHFLVAIKTGRSDGLCPHWRLVVRPKEDYVKFGASLSRKCLINNINNHIDTKTMDWEEASG